MRRIPLAIALLVLALGLALVPHHLLHASGPPDFTHFEGSQVHPIALTPSGNRLLVVNTPDNRLSVFDLTGPSPVRVAEIPVGMEPVSVAARNENEAWVVNSISDDISIVDLTTLNVKATVHVGDEPSDVVFANSRAWVSVSQEDAIKLYDPNNLTASPTVVPINARWPRSLSVSPDGSKVYCAIFNSNHRSTALSEAAAGDSLPAPIPPMRTGLPVAPKTGLIVQFNGAHWVDVSGKTWDSKVPFSMQLVELIEFDAATHAILRQTGDIATIMMGTAVNPLNGTTAVTGTYSRNEIRFEPNLSGHLTEARLGLWPTSGNRTVTQLNPHINYTVTPGPPSERDSSLGIPSGVAWSPDGQRVYVTSLATNKLGVFRVSGVTDTLIARVATVAGPTGVIADPTRPRLYVLGRFHNQLQTLSTANFSSLGVASIGFDPTPDLILNGRKFFYGGFTSGHGDEACASCHLFGDFDNLAWDLGNPQGLFAPPPNNMLDPLLTGFHPMKGPMVTQSLRGFAPTGVLHWRGDRADIYAFNPAFVSLMGRATVLPDSEMEAFKQFVTPLTYPPNPNQALDRSMPDAPSGQASALRGQTFFNNTVVDGPLRCVDCHSLPTGTNGQIIDKAALLASQDMKIPQLRNLYKKTGFKDSAGVVNRRGFGFTHNGSVDNLFDFLLFPRFAFGSPQAVADGNRRDVEAFLLAFDTGLPPAVGTQITFDGTNNSNATLVARMDTLVAQADGSNCDLIAKGRVAGEPRGWIYVGGGLWKSDRVGEAQLASATLRSLAVTGGEITVTGVPQGSGTRMGIDRDRDGYLDNDELRMGTDPGDPASHPSATAVGPPAASEFRFEGMRPNPFRAGTEVWFTLGRASHVDLAIYDLLGREVKSLARGQRLAAGLQHLSWDGRRDQGGEVAAGVYFVRLRTEAGAWTRTVVRVK